MKKRRNFADNKNGKVVETLTWTFQFLEMSKAEREAVKNKVLQDIKNSSQFKSGNYGENMYNFLTSKDVVFIGIVPNTRYFKTKGSSEEMEALWIHPHGGPTLLFSHRRGGCLFTVNPSLRINDSVLHEIPGNKINPQTGISG